MNDFIKDELLSLLKCVHLAEIDHGECADLDNLKNKIQSIIDNYCEHENKCDHDWGVGFGSIHSPVTYCKKCFCQKPMIPHDIFNKMMEVNK